MVTMIGLVLGYVVSVCSSVCDFNVLDLKEK